MKQLIPLATATERAWERFRIATERHFAEASQQSLNAKNAAAMEFYRLFCETGKER
jgi:hypothetical protein